MICAPVSGIAGKFLASLGGKGGLNDGARGATRAGVTGFVTGFSTGFATGLDGAVAGAGAGLGSAFTASRSSRVGPVLSALFA